MAEEETAVQTDEVTHDGTETADAPDTKDATEEEAKYTQAEIDRRTSEGIKAYIAKREKEAEEQRRHDEQLAAIKDGEFEKALKMTQAKLDALEAESSRSKYEAEATNVLIKMGMANYADSIIPYANNIDQVIQQAKVIQDTAEERAQAIVREKLETGPNRTPSTAHKTPDKPLDQLSVEEFTEYKRQHNLV